MAAATILDLFEAKIAPFDQPSSKNLYPTLESNMKWIGWTVAEIWPFRIFPALGEPLRISAKTYSAKTRGMGLPCGESFI